MSNSTLLLEVNNLSKKQGEQKIIHDVSFALHNGSKLAIAGATGSGKTTLLKMVAGLIQPSAGQVLLNGNKVEGPDERLLPGHPKIAYLSQHFELRSHYRISELLEMNTKMATGEAQKIFRLCDIAHLLQRKQNELSGGERQRTALARLLVGAPQLLLLDEPFSNLDAPHTALLKKIISDVSEHLNITVILVSHDARDSLSWADEIIVLSQGKIEQKANPAAIYHQPIDADVAGLFGAFNLLDEEAQDEFGIIRTDQQKGKQLMIRPEQLILSPLSGVAGYIREVKFAGPYQEAIVQTKTTQVLAYVSAKQNIRPGLAVKVQLEDDAGWYV